MTWLRISLILALCAALAACDDDGGTATEQDSTSEQDGTTTTQDTGGEDTVTGEGPCPDAVPESGATCSDEGRVCEYGDDPRASCRTTATCTSGAYAITSPRCEPLPTVTCPATREEASGQACDPQDAWCSYEDGLTCECTNCMDGPVGGCFGDPVWKCAPPNTDASCPAAKPRLGSACSQDSQMCTYHCGTDGARTCTGGGWASADGGPCPVSTRDAKRDIRYLSPAELAEVHDEVLKLKLAHYRYTDPGIAAGPQLGVILEELPQGSPAADMPRKMINLYGYASMLLAATQQQAQTIDALEERVQALEKRLEALER